MKPSSLIGLCLGFFMVIIDVTIVNVALPTLATKLHTTISWLQWIVDGYTLSFAGLLLTAGYLSDQFNAKNLFKTGVIFFALTSLCCGLSSTPWLLTTFRMLQGISAALVLPTSLSLICAAFTEQKSRAKAIGIWAGTGGLAAAMGPVAGAILTSAFSWRAVFFVNLPVAIICLWLTKNIATTKLNNNHKSFDWPGQIFAIISIASLAFTAIEVGRFGFDNPLVISSFIIFCFSILFFIISEMKVKSPMLPLIFFRKPAFTIAIICGLLLNFGVYGEFFILPLYFQHLRDYSVLTTGLALTPLTIIMPISSYFSGKLIARIGANWPAILGLLLSAIGFICLLIAGEHSPAYYYFIMPLLILGGGISMAMPALTLIIMSSLRADSTGLASGAFNMSRQLGSLLGVAIFGSIIASCSRFIIGMHLTLYISIATYIFAALLVGLLIIKQHTKIS